MANIEARDIRIPSPFHLKGGSDDPWSYGASWHGELKTIGDASKDLFDEDDVAEVLYYHDSGDGWDGDGACVLRLKDGRLAAWECWWGPTGDSFSEDAYGGDGDVWFANAADLNTLLLQAFGDEARRALGIPVEGVA